MRSTLTDEIKISHLIIYTLSKQLTLVEANFGDAPGVELAFLLAEGEHDGGKVFFTLD